MLNTISVKSHSAFLFADFKLVPPNVIFQIFQSRFEIVYLCHDTIGVSPLYFYHLQGFSLLFKRRKIHRQGRSWPYTGLRCHRKLR